MKENETAVSRIVRVFRGRVWPGSQQEYARMLLEEAIPQFRSHPGLVDITVAEPIQPGDDEFLVISVWRSLADLRDFVGERWYEAKMVPPEQELLRAKSIHHYRTSPREATSAPEEIPDTRDAIADEVEAQGFRVSVSRGVAAFDGRRLELPPREIAALAALTGRLGDPVSAQELALRIWPTRPFTDTTDVRRVIYLIRDRLTEARVPFRIRTRRGQGYVLEPTRRRKASARS
jgi:DNA-binding winged helix-turn-helix (wHTH) protein/heme-degrading monooxygenase HmoA